LLAKGEGNVNITAANTGL